MKKKRLTELPLYHRDHGYYGQGLILAQYNPFNMQYHRKDFCWVRILMGIVCFTRSGYTIERSVTFSRALAIVFLKSANQIRTCILHDNIMEFVTLKTTAIGDFLSIVASFTQYGERQFLNQVVITENKKYLLSHA